MPGVGPALIADDDVVLFGEQVDDLALGLVAPLQSDHASSRHRTALKCLYAKDIQTRQFTRG